MALGAAEAVGVGLVGKMAGVIDGMAGVIEDKQR